MKNEQFTPHIDRLEKASVVLREAGALLQSIARRYYLVYAYAVQAAEKHDVVLRRGVKTDDGRRTSHQALPNLILALYSARNSGPVLGGGPGVTRAGRLPDGLAYKYVDQLQKDRKYADYGYVNTVEPYDETIADERLRWANHVIEDLRSLLLTATAEPPDAVEGTAGNVKAAHVFFLAGLAAIVGDMRGLTVGDDEFDYFICIPLSDLHETGQRISELQFTVMERFGVTVTALPITVAR